jgi:hypothetical protein
MRTRYSLSDGCWEDLDGVDRKILLSVNRTLLNISANETIIDMQYFIDSALGEFNSEVEHEN